ncbi:hypothetical protein BC941DRAFT_469856 [Chlamydoabsidia padenii]|nr:hypothetical protein BC941DRAFT_469856 [Chlamydoabsidia padenii]
MARIKQGMREARRKRKAEDEDGDDQNRQPDLLPLDQKASGEQSKPPKRQRRGKSKNISRRKQDFEGKKGKKTHQKDIQDQNKSRKSPPTCIKEKNVEASKTHSRSSNKFCKQKATREMVQLFVDGERLSNRGNSCFVQRQRSKKDGSWKKWRRQFDKFSQGIPSIQPKTRKWKKHPFEESNKIPLLYVGDGKFDRRSSREKPRGLVKVFRKATKLAQRQHLMFVVDVNEQYTLKLCSRCGKRSLDNVRVGDNRRNIHSLALFEICGLVPDVFTRGYVQTPNENNSGIIGLLSGLL